MEDVSTQLQNAAKTAGQRGIRRYTRFLDPAQAQEAARIATRCGVELSLWGGYEGAERAVACFSAPGDAPETAEYPVVCLHARCAQRFFSITHRDILGAFMALGLTRDTVGDIILSDADIFLFTQRAGLLCALRCLTRFRRCRRPGARRSAPSSARSGSTRCSPLRTGFPAARQRRLSAPGASSSITCPVSGRMRLWRRVLCFPCAAGAASGFRR